MLPTKLEYGVPYPDGSGIRVGVRLDAERRVVRVVQGDSTIDVSFEDFALLMGMLQDVAGTVEEYGC